MKVHLYWAEGAFYVQWGQSGERMKFEPWAAACSLAFGIDRSGRIEGRISKP